VELYILDEPTSGLDPLMEEAFRDCVRRLRADGRTVLLSSHVLAEVEALCDRLSIIRAGRTVESGSLADLRHLTRTTVTVRSRTPVTGLADLPGVHDVLADHDGVRFQVEAGGMEAVLLHLTRFGVTDLTCTPPTLEELFLRHYTGAPELAGVR
jgi:ABC-2 type transport system ATP-binding protein